MKANGVNQAAAMSFSDAAIFNPVRLNDTFADFRRATNQFLVSRGQRIGNGHGFQYGKGTKRK